MITGDHKVTASAIARQIGILREGGRALEGAELERMSDEELREQVEEISVYARVSPEHKIRIVRAWQENGHIAAMTGDGERCTRAETGGHRYCNGHYGDRGF